MSAQRVMSCRGFVEVQPDNEITYNLLIARRIHGLGHEI